MPPSPGPDGGVKVEPIVVDDDAIIVQRRLCGDQTCTHIRENKIRIAFEGITKKAEEARAEIKAELRG
jgi:hypothetical protein